MCLLEAVLEAGEAGPDLVEGLVELDVLVVVGVEVLLVLRPLVGVRDGSVVSARVQYRDIKV